MRVTGDCKLPATMGPTTPTLGHQGKEVETERVLYGLLPHKTEDTREEDEARFIKIWSPKQGVSTKVIQFQPTDSRHMPIFLQAVLLK